MYYCKSCGSTFGQPERKKNGQYICPDCGSRQFEEAKQCPICKDYFIPDRTYDKYCDDCIESALDQLRQAIDRHVDPDYIELLREEFGDLDYIMDDSQD